MDPGTPELAKRKRLRVEAIHGGVRVRDTDEDVLTSLYWHGLLTDTQYSVGLSFQRDLWKASLLGTKAANTEPSSRTAHYGNLPGSLVALTRVNEAMRHVAKEYGSKAAQVMIGAAQGGFSKEDLGLLVSALSSLDRHYTTKDSPLLAMAAITSRLRPRQT